MNNMGGNLNGMNFLGGMNQNMNNMGLNLGGMQNLQNLSGLSGLSGMSGVNSGMLGSNDFNYSDNILNNQLNLSSLMGQQGQNKEK